MSYCYTYLTYSWGIFFKLLLYSTVKVISFSLVFEIFLAVKPKSESEGGRGRKGMGWGDKGGGVGGSEESGRGRGELNIQYVRHFFSKWLLKVGKFDWAHQPWGETSKPWLFVVWSFAKLMALRVKIFDRSFLTDIIYADIIKQVIGHKGFGVYKEYFLVWLSAWYIKERIVTGRLIYLDC